MTEKYLLLTPGPLSTSEKVRKAMMTDRCTWDSDYNNMVQEIREELVSLAVKDKARKALYTSVLMQGSGTFGVEAVTGSVIPKGGKLAVLSNGAYGRRIAEIAERLHIPQIDLRFDECERPDSRLLAELLSDDPAITHVAVVHCETTTGILNDIASVAKTAKSSGKTLIIDAMSSFGGIPFFIDELDADFVISSANKCVEGVPGFSFIIAKRASLEKCAGCARSLSLDLYSQWKTMEEQGGKWRFTSPTHCVAAFKDALRELKEEGGVAARSRRYQENERLLAEGMEKLGFAPVLPKELRSPIITSFFYPDKAFDFAAFCQYLKKEGFVIYPGKLTEKATFRIGNIGSVSGEDITRLLSKIAAMKNSGR